jgi:hypothetical protein
VNYAVGRSIDDTSDTDAGLSAFMPTRLDRERGRSTFDIRHNFSAHGMIFTPPPTGSALHRVFGNMTISPVVYARSGIPFTLRIGRDSNGDTHGAYDRPFLADRNTGRGAAFISVDLRVSRTFALGRRYQVQAMVDASNLFNRVNFIAVNDVIGTDPQLLRGPFDVKGRRDLPGTSPLGFSVAAPARQLQFGIRVQF